MDLNKETNTNPFSQIGIFNKEEKKKPYDVKIKNYNPNEPKIKVNMKYSDKQRYRRYKTKIEPNLFSKIMIDEEDDIVNTIKKAFGIDPEKKRNFSNVETSGTPSNPELNPIPVEVVPTKYIDNIPEPAPAPEQRFREAAPAPIAAATPKPKSKAKAKTDEIEPEPETSRELTATMALPSPLSPGSISAMTYAEAGKKAKAEAEERRRVEEEAAAKKRLLELSKMVAKRNEEEKAKRIEEREKELSGPLSPEREEIFQKHLSKEFRGLTDDNIKRLRKEYKRTLKLPDPEFYGRTPEEMEAKQEERNIASFKAAKGALSK